MNQLSRSLNLKVILTLAVLTALVVAVLASVLVTDHVRSLERDLTEKAVLLQRIAGVQLQPAVAFDDRETAREVFESLGQAEDIARLALYRQDGSPIHVWGLGESDAPPWSDKIASARNANELVVTGPVVSAEGPKGTFLIAFSTQHLQTHVQNSLRNAVGLAVIVFALALLFTWRLGRRVVSRVRAVTDYTAQVATGDLTVRHIHTSSGDEIDQLTLSFQSMVSSLREMVKHFAGVSKDLREATAVLGGMAAAHEGDAADAMGAGIQELGRFSDDIEGSILRFRGLEDAQ